MMPRRLRPAGPRRQGRSARFLADPRARVPGERLRRAAVLGIAALPRGLLEARLPGVLGLARAEALGMDGVHLVALAPVLDRAVARVLDVVAGAGGERRGAAVLLADLDERLAGGGQVPAARALHEHEAERREDDDAGENGPREQTRHTSSSAGRRDDYSVADPPPAGRDDVAPDAERHVVLAAQVR